MSAPNGIENISWDAVGTVIAAISAVLVAASLLYLARQTQSLMVQNRQQESNFSLMNQSATHARLFDVSAAFLQRPAIRRFFYEDEADMSEEEACIRTVAEMLADALEPLVAGPTAKHVPPYWVKYVEDAFLLSAAFRTFIIERSDWYAPELVAVAVRAQEQATQNITD